MASEQITMKDLDGALQGEHQLRVLIYTLAQLLIPLVEAGARALRRNDEIELREIDDRYSRIRGDGGRPADIRPYLDIGSGRPYRTVKLAVAAMLHDCRPDLGWAKPLRYRYPLYRSSTKKRG